MMDDFKPRKPANYARLTRPTAPPTDPALDAEIGDAFAPPEQVAAADAVDDIVTIDNTSKKLAVVEDPAISQKSVPPTKDFKPPAGAKKPSNWWPPKKWTKKQWLIVSGVVVLLIAIALVLILVVFKPKKAAPVVTPPKKAVVVVPPKPTTVASRLTGLQVTPEQSQLPVTGVMIENSLDARPQSGLEQAGVVFEAVAEGGVTRFLAVFEDTQPTYVGPVRSARPYYIRWLLPFDAAYAHVGGSPDALADIQTLGVKDLNQFYNSGPYTRITSRDAPHNVYATIPGLISLEKTKGYSTSTFTGFPRKADAPSKAPNATSLDFIISGPSYSAHFDYNPANNTYKRSEAGQPHMEVDQYGNQAQISPKVVLALVMPESSGALDSSGAYYTNYQTTGTGQMYVFQDGTVTSGTWSKTDDKSQFSFTDADGKTIPLNAGQTWISVVGLAGDVSYK